jgi:hypothetical protein
MTIFFEDPHDNWYAGLLADGVQIARDRAGRAQFWLGSLAALAVFWSAIAWAAYFIL